MTTKLCIPLLLLAAACGDNLEPDPIDDQSSFGSEEAPDDGGGSAARDFYASPLIYFPSCDAAVASFEADARYVGDGVEILPNFSCKWTFDDGTTFEGCAGEHTFEEAGFHDFTVDVTNEDTGEVRSASQRRYVDPPIEATLDVTTGDRTITVNAEVNVGQTKVFVEPTDLVITDDPFYYLKRSYTVGVKRDGAYKVVLEIEDERPVGPICTKRIEKTVNVYCTGGEHTHPH